ncbi:integrase core domain-containing protein [Rhodovulum sulfidophilum]
MFGHARNLIAAWRDDYNHNRPHTSLDELTRRGSANGQKGTKF